MRLVDADDFYKPFEDARKILKTIGYVLPEEMLDAVLGIYDEIKERLDATPTVDAVKVVRCKDCKHWYSDADTGMACEFTNMGQPEDGFCNWAERRSDAID